eukprot:TRINITY_DN15270_c0_g1_i3.p2 TRINITY_DN15270_c0_g1~~TRINITY_DN15270_c0_g1_i3.p2  ORF type:complete len:164 (-),score=26.53 TRINITY_DN15270_c0_g1_i3:583-1074(-)
MHGEANRNLGPTLVGLIFLLLSLTGAILKLPSFLILDEQSIYLKVIWQYLIVLVVLCPILVIDFFDSAQYFAAFADTSFLSVFVLSLLHMAFVYLVYFSATKTFVIHTLLIVSMSLTFSTTWKIIRSVPFTRLEYIGIAINVLGVYLCCCESATMDSNSVATL